MSTFSVAPARACAGGDVVPLRTSWQEPLVVLGSSAVAVLHYAAVSAVLELCAHLSTVVGSWLCLHLCGDGGLISQ